LPVDPWGREYGYELASPGRPRIFSLGADGQPGGAGDDEDLDNLLLRNR
jgi:general secretion pathway protein G